MDFGLSPNSPADPLASLQAMFGQGDPVSGGAANLKDSGNPVSISELRAAIIDRYESAVLTSPSPTPVSYAFPTGLGGGSVSIGGTPEPVSSTVLFLQPQHLNSTAYDSPLTVGDLINLAA